MGPPVSPGVVVPVPARLPKLERTFGEVLMGAHGSCAIRYKSIAVLLAAGTDAMEAGRLRQEGFAVMKEVKMGRAGEVAPFHLVMNWEKEMKRTEMNCRCRS